MDLARDPSSQPRPGSEQSHREPLNKFSRSRGPCAQIESYPDLASVSDLWRELETAGASGPYQRRAWFKAWTTSVAVERGERPLIVVARDEQSRPTFLLPLVVRASLGLTIARFAGGKHANFNTPVLARGVQLGPHDVHHALAAVARLEPDIDLFLLDALPASFDGTPNPLVGPNADIHTAQGSLITLTTEGEPPVRSKRLREERRRERGLLRHGSVEIRVASGEAEIQQALSVFADQKAYWFAGRKMPNPFKEAGVPAFLNSLARDPDSGFVLHTLLVGGVVVAVSGTLKVRERASLMLVSYDATSSTAAFGPGTRLIRAVMAQMRRDGCTEFDLGLGEAAYKLALGARAVPVYILAQPANARGRIGAAVLGLARRGKILTKRHPQLVHLLQQLRTLRPVRRPDVVP